MILSNRNLVACIAFLALAPFAACGDDDPAVESVDVEGCEHLQEGPAVAVTATLVGDTTTPAIAGDHKRYDVTLLAAGGQRAGVVSFAAAEATDYVFFFDASVPLEIIDSAGTVVAIEASTTSSTECTDIKARHVVELAVGTYFLELGPTAETDVGIVVEEALGHGPE